jgi:hypothetical protein
MREIVSIAAREALLQQWIEQHLGPVTRIERQPRWRPAWAVDVQRDGAVLPLYVKGAREDVHAVVPVKLEGAALAILHEQGVPAPRQYGYCEAADAIVMERLPGESRLENIADVAVRDRVVDQYVQAMVRFHALDPALFVAAGYPQPRQASDLRLAQFNRAEMLYLEKKRVPEPGNEFLRLWVRRNVPVEDIRPSFITGDAFQMLFHQGRLMGVMDLEMAFIGDPLFDLCTIGMRDLGEKTGDVAAITRRYEQLSRRPVDRRLLRFHLVSFSIASSLLISDVLFNPAPDTDYFEYHVYYHGSLRIALEALAEYLGVELEEFVPPAPVATADAIHLDMLAALTRQLAAAAPSETYARDKALAEIAFMQRRATFGQTLDAAYLDDVARHTGARPANVRLADAQVETLVHALGPDGDVPLLQLLYRQVQRECFLADLPQNGRLRRFLRERIAPLR